LPTFCFYFGLTITFTPVKSSSGVYALSPATSELQTCYSFRALYAGANIEGVGHVSTLTVRHSPMSPLPTRLLSMLNLCKPYRVWCGAWQIAICKFDGTLLSP